MPRSTRRQGPRPVNVTGRRRGAELVVCLVAVPCRSTAGLVLSLRQYRPLRVCAATPDQVAGARWRLSRDPHVILIDEAAGIDRSIRAADVLRELYPRAPIVVLGEVDVPGVIARMTLRCGASGFADKKRGAIGIVREILAAAGSWPGHSARILSHSGGRKDAIELNRMRPLLPDVAPPEHEAPAPRDPAPRRAG